MAENKPKDERINSIIEAAVSEFLEKGYEKTSVDSISRKAGLSKGGFYHHFKNKDEILIASNNRCMEPIDRLIAETKKNQDSESALKNFIIEYLDYWREHTRELQITYLALYKIINEKNLWSVTGRYSKIMTSFFETLYIKGIMSGRFIKHDPQSRAVALFSSLEGIKAYLATNENFKTDRAAKNLISIFVDEILQH